MGRLITVSKIITIIIFNFFFFFIYCFVLFVVFLVGVSAFFNWGFLLLFIF